MRRLAFALTLASLPLLAARPSRGAEADPMLARVGGEMYQQYCASCHGPGGEGDGPVASALKKLPADLTKIAARRDGKFPESDIARWIDGRFDVVAHGSREMPVWGRKFADHIAEGVDTDEVVRGRVLTIVEYLKTIQKK
jgi:mono/diheme cytochrome c family protein